MAMIRAFIAIELTEELLDRLVQVQEELRRDAWADQVRWVRPEGIHLTLKFLGNVPEDRIPAIEQALHQAITETGVEPFTLRAGGLGAFPNFRRPAVIWVGVQGEVEPLQRLQEAIEAAMEELGFQREDRPFHPHLTLGRVHRRAGSGYRRKLGEALQAYDVGEVGDMQVEEVTLMRSQLHPKGAIYTQLAVHRLRGA